MTTFANYLVSAALIAVGVIHLLPLAGVAGAVQLAALYGADFSAPDLQILMRHRAVLFGILGTFLVYSAFKRSLQAVALSMAFASVSSFLLLATVVGDYNEQVTRVVTADLFALVLVVIAAAARALAGHAPGESTAASRRPRI